MGQIHWTELDFAEMGWHDCKIYALSFNEETFQLALDIDHILKWIEPAGESENYTFEVAPATLIFKWVSDFEMNTTSVGLTIIAIIKSDHFADISGNRVFDWEIKLTQGNIFFKAIGFEQHLRGQPFVSEQQQLEFAYRGGVSF